MFRIRYYEAESADPIVKVLSSDLATIFGRPYAGYLLFLFGAADEEFAGWFARNVVALDSLTGPYVAGAVFASRVKLEVKRHPRSAYVRRNADGRQDEIDLGNILFDVEQAIAPPPDYARETRPLGLGVIVERLVGRKRESRWTESTDDIVAITYAADEIAKALGVLDSLPCLVLFDAFPSVDIEILHLTEYTSQGLIPLLRRVVQGFEHESFREYFERLDAVIRAGEELSAIQKELAQREQDLEKAYGRVSFDLPAAPAKAKRSILEGDIRSFCTIIEAMTRVNGKPAIQAPALIIDELIRYSKTLRNLRYFCSACRWPLQEPLTARLHRILEKYVYPDHPEFSNSSESAPGLMRIITVLTKEHEELADQMTAFLPTPEELQASVTEQFRHDCSPLQEEISLLRSTLERADVSLQSLCKSLSSVGHPSLRKAFRAVARDRKISTMTRDVGQAAISLSGSFLKPDVLLKIWNAFHH